MLGWLLYTDIVSLVIILSWEAFKQSTGDKGFFPEEF